MEDVNKKKRSLLWWVFLFSIISIPFLYNGKSQISEVELVTIENLTLSKSPYLSSGKRRSITIDVINTDRTIIVNLEEIKCVNEEEVLEGFKKGDVIAIKIFRSDLEDFYKTSFPSLFQKIYGLKKDGKEFLELSCRNEVKAKESMGAVYASIASAILSLILAIFVFKPKTRQQARRQIKVEPFFLICICWIIVLIIFRLIL